MAKRPKPVVLAILDGWGVNPKKEGNAIALANLPVYSSLLKNYPNTTLNSCGEAVGLPEGQMGNSEVGHLNIGAGRIVYQDLTRIDKAIRDSGFSKNSALVDAMIKAKKNGSSLHLLGLVSDGGVHSHINHLFALLGMARENGLRDVYIHVFLDGRDTSPKSGMGYIKHLEDYLKKTGSGRIATVSGRYYAMDRDKRWDRIEKAYNAMVLGEGERSGSALQAAEESYKKDITDEFVVPAVIVDDKGQPIAVIRDNDSVIFFNFRADRAREITSALISEDFTGFQRRIRPRLSIFVPMTNYDDNLHLLAAFPPVKLTNILGGVISRNGLKQLRIAETEKYAHVTYFFNGGDEKAFEGEERILIPSPRDIPTYDKKPEMSAYELTDEAVRQIEARKYDLIVLNYANADMVGHTGMLNAAIKAVETVDKCLGRILEAVKDIDGILIVTADHGDADQMVDYETGQPHTAHTMNPVPFILVDRVGVQNFEPLQLREKGIFADIAPTILELMGIPKPVEMTGVSLIEHRQISQL
ncbi:MAG: 2,3-bisphosphoglycerate-independent phosphoglycerate mutase [Nitrospirae bacterium]|nr:2,3-bisphosphoglycerate-independent phosphoglycerate mutase [Nitrospirota bacterium]